MPSLNQPIANKTQELRCFCSARPILAIIGVDLADNRIYIHQKVWKGQKLYSESFIKGGDVMIRCRVCFRLHNVNIKEETGLIELELVNESPREADLSA